MCRWQRSCSRCAEEGKPDFRYDQQVALSVNHNTTSQGRVLNRRVKGRLIGSRRNPAPPAVVRPGRQDPCLPLPTDLLPHQ